MTVYFNVVALASGRSGLLDVLPGLRLSFLIGSILNIIDMSQRKSFDWKLHVHHVVLCAGGAFIVDGNLPSYQEAGLTLFSFWATMHEPVWVLWSLEHLRHQREKEPVEEREMNDAFENFPSPKLYKPNTLRNLWRVGFIHYTALAQGGTLALLVTYMLRFYEEITVVWRWLIPIVYLFIIALDMSVALVMYEHAQYTTPAD